MLASATVEIPASWLWVTGIACVILILLFLTITALVFVLINMVKRLQEPVTSLLTKVNHDITPKVETLVTKVDGLTDKVHGIADKVDGLADKAKGTVDSISDRTTGIVRSVEGFANVATQQFQKAAPIIGIAIAGLRLFAMMKEARGQKPGKVKVQKRPDGIEVEIQPNVDNGAVESGTVLAHRGVEQSGSSSGS